MPLDSFHRQDANESKLSSFSAMAVPSFTFYSSHGGASHHGCKMQGSKHKQAPICPRRNQVSSTQLQLSLEPTRCLRVTRTGRPKGSPTLHTPSQSYSYSYELFVLGAYNMVLNGVTSSIQATTIRAESLRSSSSHELSILIKKPTNEFKTIPRNIRGPKFMQVSNLVRNHWIQQQAQT